MAKNFYSQEEVCEKLDMTTAQLKDLVRNGSLREFRDAGKITYKADEVDKMAAAADSDGGVDDLHGSLSSSIGDLDLISTGELTLEDSSAGSDDGMELRFADDDDDSPDDPPASKPSSPPDLGASGSLSLAMDDLSEGSTGDSMSTGELVLEPAEEGGSGIEMGKPPEDADALSLDDTTVGESEEDDKEGTVVTSIGVSVFDDDDVEQEADPLAQTIVSDGSEALGIDGVGSGSGLLDLTRESDDTSLGADLLDEIYRDGEGEGEGDEMSEATRAGLEDAIPEPTSAASTGFAPVEESVMAAPAAAVVVTQTRVEYGHDAVSTGLTGMMFVGVLVMCIAGLTTAAAMQDAWPAILETLYKQNWIVGAASLGAAALAMLIGYFLGKRSSG